MGAWQRHEPLSHKRQNLGECGLQIFKRILLFCNAEKEVLTRQEECSNIMVERLIDRSVQSEAFKWDRPESGAKLKQYFSWLLDECRGFLKKKSRRRRWQKTEFASTWGYEGQSPPVAVIGDKFANRMDENITVGRWPHCVLGHNKPERSDNWGAHAELVKAQPLPFLQRWWMLFVWRL